MSYDLFFTGHFVASVPVWTALYVYPKAADAQRLDLPFRNLMGQALARRSLLLDPFETQSVRPYESYDPYRSVNWKATARTGELKVNVFSPTASWVLEAERRGRGPSASDRSDGDQALH